MGDFDTFDKCLESRGLLEIELEKDMEARASAEFDRARYDLEVANFLFDNEYFDWSIIAAYNVMLHTITGAIVREGYYPKNHWCRFLAAKRLFSKGVADQLKRAFTIRSSAAYITSKGTRQKDALDFIKEAEAFLDKFSGAQN